MVAFAGLISTLGIVVWLLAGPLHGLMLLAIALSVLGSKACDELVKIRDRLPERL